MCAGYFALSLQPQSDGHEYSKSDEERPLPYMAKKQTVFSLKRAKNRHICIKNSVIWPLLLNVHFSPCLTKTELKTGYIPLKRTKKQAYLHKNSLFWP